MAWTQAHGAGFRGVYLTPEGLRKTTVMASRLLAKRAAEAEEAKVRDGSWFDPFAGKVTFSDYFEKQWFPNRGGEQGTRDTYASHYRATLKDRFGAMELRAILPSTVQGWVTEMNAAGVKPSTIRAKVRALQTVLAAEKGASAMRDGLIQRNPCAGVMLPTIVEPEVQIYQPEEVVAIIEALDPWWRTLALLGSESGGRWGELMGLTLIDFGVEYRKVTFRRTVVETAIANTGNGTRFTWKDYPKGKRSRTLGIRGMAADAVKAMAIERDLRADDRLFSMPDTSIDPWVPLRTDVWPGGVPVSRAFFRQSVWMPALQAADVPYRKFHALRGSHLSWLIAAGADMNTVMERAGHLEYDTTRRYMAPLTGADDLALSALDNLMSTRRKATP